MGSKLVVFDVDGTLECSKGSIPLSALLQLKKQGWTVYIVGNYSRIPEGYRDKLPNGNPKALPKDNALSNLRKNLKPSVCIYVGDLESDKNSAEKAGFKFIWAHEFDIGKLSK